MPNMQRLFKRTVTARPSQMLLTSHAHPRMLIRQSQKPQAMSGRYSFVGRQETISGHGLRLCDHLTMRSRVSMAVKKSALHISGKCDICRVHTLNTHQHRGQKAITSRALVASTLTSMASAWVDSTG